MDPETGKINSKSHCKGEAAKGISRRYEVPTLLVTEETKEKTFNAFLMKPSQGRLYTEVLGIFRASPQCELKGYKD